MKRVALLVLMLGIGIGALPSEAVQTLRWERLPLAVPLIVGQERVLFIDRNVRVGVPAALSEQLRVQSAGGALYLRASAPFESTRLQLQDVDSSALILLDITASPPVTGEPPLQPIRITESGRSTTSEHDPAATVIDDSTSVRSPSSSIPTPVPVVLTRYAAQNLYAPLRTVERVGGISRVPLRRDLALDTLLPMLPVHAKALVAWRLEDHWVTAIRLTNTSDQWVELDPRALQGDFIAATFQHHNLGPARDSTDTTVLYLVTRGHGLAEGLLPVVSPIDPSVNLPTSQGREP